MNEIDSDANVPEHDRLAEAIAHTLESGGEPTPRELEKISGTIRAEITKAAALTVRRIAPRPRSAAVLDAYTQQAPPSGGDLMNLRKWVLRAWLAAGAAIVAAACVAMYCSIRFSRPELRTAGVPTPSPALENTSKPSEKKGAGLPVDSRPAMPSTMLSPSGAEPGLWNAVPKADGGPGASSERTQSIPEKISPAPPAVSSAPQTPAVDSALIPGVNEPKTNAQAAPQKSMASNDVPKSAPISPITPTPSVATAATAPTVGDDLVVIAMGGMPVEGYPVTPASEDSFKMKLRGSGQVVTLRWSSLDEIERHRVKQLYGIDDSAGRVVYGDKIVGLRLHLTSGRTLDALPLPKQDVNGQRAFRTTNAPKLMIPKADIVSEEPLQCYESDYFTRHEIYDRWVEEKPPVKDDASSYLELAVKCARLGLYPEALDALKSAGVIDPRVTDRNQGFRTEIQAEYARQQAQELYATALRACGARDYFTAAECIEKLDRNFATSELKSRWDNLREEIAKGARLELRKRVTEMSYSVMLELLHRQISKRIKVDAKGNIVASLPGKQVTTTHGHVFKGVLQPSDSPNILSIKSNDMILAIPQSEIVAVDDVDLSAGAAEAPLGYDELHDYVCNPRRPDGLKAQMVIAIAKTLRGAGVTEQEVRDIFEHRLEKEARYENGNVIANPVYASIQDAFYGKGSWLREGSAPTPLVPEDGDAISRYHTSRGQTYQNPKTEDAPEISDDPNVWWTSLSADEQFRILRAMAGERVFSAKVTEQRCNDCNGTGVTQVHGATYRCPVCRGMKVLFKLTYQ